MHQSVGKECVWSSIYYLSFCLTGSEQRGCGSIISCASFRSFAWCSRLLPHRQPIIPRCKTFSKAPLLRKAPCGGARLCLRRAYLTDVRFNAMLDAVVDEQPLFDVRRVAVLLMCSDNATSTEGLCSPETGSPAERCRARSLPVTVISCFIEDNVRATIAENNNALEASAEVRTVTTRFGVLCLPKDRN